MDQFDLSGLNAQLEKTVRLLSQAEASSSRIATNLSSGMSGGTGGVGQGGSGNILQSSLGQISQSSSPLGTAATWLGAGASAITGNMGWATLGQAVGGGINYAVQSGANVAQSYLQSMSALKGPAIARATSYYNAVVGQGGGMGMNASMQNSTFRAFRNGGMSYAGADADVAGFLSARGMVFNGASGSTYMQTVNEVAAAGKYLNMNNMSAARAFEGMTSGSMSQNLLSMGINTSDAKTGKALKTSDVFEQIYSRMTTGRRQASTEETLESLRRGYLGASLNNMGFTEDQKQLFQQFAIAKSKGTTLDFGNNEQMSQLFGEQAAQGNANPQAALQSLAFEETRLMKTAADAFIQGMNDAVPAVQAMTTAMINFGDLGGEVLLRINTALDTFGGSTAGDATNKVLSFQKEKFDNTAVGQIVNNLFAPLVGTAVGLYEFGAATGSLLQTMFGGGSGNNPNNGGGQGGADGVGMTAGGGGGSFGRPVSGKVNSPYGPRKHPLTGQNKTHRGVDLDGRTGDGVYCAADGVVTKIGHNMDKKSGYGHNVTVDHENGYETLYAHLSKVSVREGQRVRKGDKIGEVGMTGAATGPHLHWEVRKNGQTIDPMTVVGTSLGTTNTTTPSTDTRPAWMKAGADLVSGRSGSGYLPADQTALTSGSVSTPSPIGARPSAGTSSNKPGMGGGTELFTISKNTMMLDMAEIQSRYLGKSGANKSTKKSDGSHGSGSNVTINVTVAQATPAEAKKLAEMVKEYISDDNHIGMMRSK